MANKHGFTYFAEVSALRGDNVESTLLRIFR